MCVVDTWIWLFGFTSQDEQWNTSFKFAISQCLYSDFAGEEWIIWIVFSWLLNSIHPLHGLQSSLKHDRLVADVRKTPERSL